MNSLDELKSLLKMKDYADKWKARAEAVEAKYARLVERLKAMPHRAYGSCSSPIEFYAAVSDIEAVIEESEAENDPVDRR